MSDQLAALVRSRLDQPVAAEARALAAELVAAHGGAVAAILFYGSCLRDGGAGGMLDLYVLVDDYRAFHRRAGAALANRLLPPTVLHHVASGIGAKVAVISCRDFRARMRPDALDTTLWARFCQPAALLHARDEAVECTVVEALADAAATAAVWAARLGPAEGSAETYWTGLFRHTYGAELRVETGEDRSRQIYRAAAAHLDGLFEPALARSRIAVESRNGAFAPQVADRPAARRAWRRRRLAGKLLNVGRLVKAAFTFDGHADYIAWKVERHTGRPLHLTRFQRRHPVLAAPGVLWRLYREGSIR